MELTCIVCPVGCSLNIVQDSAQRPGDSTDNLPALNVTGNRCPRGIEYAREEIADPKRTVTATCVIVSDGVGSNYNLRRIPVKTTSPCPKDKIPLLLKEIYSKELHLPVKAGDVVIEDWNGIKVIATRSVK